jgi:DNA invertase Pin-like site-specific DNA recombinase
MTSPLPPSTHIIAYLRDSGGDEQELSTQQQQLEIERWCEENHLILVRSFIDKARPGSSTIGREQFNEMLAYFRNDPPESALVIWSWSRFARNSDDAAFYRAELRRHGILIHSLKDNLPQGKEARVFEALIDYVNEKRLDEISVDVKRGLRHLVEQYGCVPGVPPRGFMRVPVQIGERRGGGIHTAHRWVPDPAYIDRIRLAFQMRAEGASLWAIQSSTRLYRSVNSWTTFFSNKIYIGTLEFSNLTIPNYCEPIVDVELWNQVQARASSRAHSLKANSPDHPRRKSSNGLLSGLLRCEICGSLLGVEVTAPKGKPSFAYYRCSGYTVRRNCNAKRVPLFWFETFILDEIRDHILAPENIARFYTEVRVSSGDETKRADRIKDLNSSIARLDQQIAHTTDAIADSGKSAALLKKLSTLETEHTRNQSELLGLQYASPAPDRIFTPEQISAILRDRLEKYRNDPEQMKPFLRAIVAQIVVLRSKNQRLVTGEITYRIPRITPREPSDDESSGDGIIFMSSLSPTVGALKNDQNR